MSRRSPEVLLGHILESAAEAVGFIEGKCYKELEGDRKLQHALVRCVEIIGEASAQLGKEFRDAHPEVPWADAIAMRNRLIHVYAEIELDIVWSTCHDELPKLIEQVTAVQQKLHE